MKLQFLRQIFNKFQISNLIKIRPVGADGRTDGRTDRYDEVNSNFS